jgi:hypothetical protein
MKQNKHNYFNISRDYRPKGSIRPDGSTSPGNYGWLFVTITVLSIIHSLVFYLKYILGTGFCLILQVEPPQVGPTERASLCLRTTETRLDRDRMQTPKRCVLKKIQDN